MAYHGFLPLCKKHLHALNRSPAVLEVGVDRGVSFITLAAFLARTKSAFTMVGVDILVQEQVQIVISNLDLTPSQQVYLLEENSLVTLPKLAQLGLKFDVILLDGDHNYHTVKSELEYVADILNDDGIMIVDDYDGRWSEKDLWYCDRPGYENVKIASRPVDTDKHGVKAAVDEWLVQNPEWALSKPVMGEPVLLNRR